MSARASATASPRAINTTYLLFAAFAGAFLFAFGADLVERFFAGFIVVFFAAGFFAGARLAAGFV